MTNEKLNKLNEDILNISCKGIRCDDCPLTMEKNCELRIFKKLIREKFKNFKPEKCPNCGKEMD